MAFEKINEYTDHLAYSYRKLGSKINDPNVAKEYRVRYRIMQDSVFTSIVSYYQIVLATAKFRAQREYCKKIMKELEPDFCKGFFKENIVKLKPIVRSVGREHPTEC